MKRGWWHPLVGIAATLAVAVAVGLWNAGVLG